MAGRLLSNGHHNICRSGDLSHKSKLLYALVTESNGRIVSSTVSGRVMDSPAYSFEP